MRSITKFSIAASAACMGVLIARDAGGLPPDTPSWAMVACVYGVFLFAALPFIRWPKLKD